MSTSRVFVFYGSIIYGVTVKRIKGAISSFQINGYVSMLGPRLPSFLVQPGTLNRLFTALLEVYMPSARQFAGEVET
jgi:hypothetical protein